MSQSEMALSLNTRAYRKTFHFSFRLAGSSINIIRSSMVISNVPRPLNTQLSKSCESLIVIADQI